MSSFNFCGFQRTFNMHLNTILMGLCF